MSELWEINMEIWCLPVGIEWRSEDHGKVELGAGVPLLNIQRKCLVEVMQQFGHEDGGNYLIYREDLVKIAVKSKHSDPERVVRWEPCRIPVEDMPEETAEEFEFLDQFCRYGWITDIERMQHVWRALCKHMVHWLVIQNKTLDLKFCRIVNLPFRGNWRESLRQKFPKLTSMDCQTKEAQEVIMQEMLNPEMLSHSLSSGRIWHCLNIVPLRLYWTNVRKIEQIRENEQRENYWHSVRNRMKASLTDALETFIRYLQEIRHPFPFAFSCDNEGDSILPKGWGRISDAPWKSKKTPYLPDSVNRPSWEVQERIFENLDTSPPCMQEVPDL